MDIYGFRINIGYMEQKWNCAINLRLVKPVIFQSSILSSILLRDCQLRFPCKMYYHIDSILNAYHSTPLYVSFREMSSCPLALREIFRCDNLGIICRSTYFRINQASCCNVGIEVT